eukprot:gnl/MRDRNA2_/MRDRNA2_104652_c0_seq1.p1 gnl/MRDRNA2_/MRDRNA2_104652_c0~~gnl/MRDRNA2_/MRDRNA2_104652_c0_seq1.p1  ORF type:complete len:215 (+),score=46.71 gnl/MRDRNA2_/MRDRNA2_104652_c0_seq1:76-720(+)
MPKATSGRAGFGPHIAAGDMVVASKSAVVRGPQSNVPKESAELTPDEARRAERTFQKHDKTKSGEIDVSEFHNLCKSLDLPLDFLIESKWLKGKSEAKGLTLEDFVALYGRILAAQTPAVRQTAGNKPCSLMHMRGTETQMRAAFDKYAGETSVLTKDQLRELFAELCFPDHNGDGFEQYVDEWFASFGKDDETVDFHEFVSAINSLVTFCESH